MSQRSLAPGLLDCTIAIGLLQELLVMGYHHFLRRPKG